MVQTARRNFSSLPLRGRVHHQHVAAAVFGGHAREEAACVVAVDTNVAGAVALRVAGCVLDGFRVQLHTDDLGAAVGGRDADGADPAIGIKEHFPPGQPRVPSALL